MSKFEEILNICDSEVGIKNTYIDQHRSNISHSIEARHIPTEFVKVFIHSAQIDGRCVGFTHFFRDFLVDIGDLASENQ